MTRTGRRQLVPLALLLLLLACGREERTLSVRGTLSAERQRGADAELMLEGRLHQNDLPGSDFNATWNVVTRGAASVPAIAVTIAGGSERDASGNSVLAAMILVLPTPLTAGTVYPIERALAVPANVMPIYWSFWGPVQLNAAASADIGLRIFDYQATGMIVQNDHVAVSAEGTVTVLRRLGEQVELRLDVMTRDAAATQVRLRGDIILSPERYTPPIS